MKLLSPYTRICEAYPRTIVTAFIGLALVMRLIVWLTIGGEPESDGLAYFSMAQHMAAGSWPVDHNGLNTFYSVGYPLFLVPFFALFGAKLGVVIAANLLLAAWSGWLIYALAIQLRFSVLQRQTTIFFYALWLAGMWNTAVIARENLSVPLLLLVIYYALKLAKTEQILRTALLCGLTYGASVLTGSSAVPVILAPLTALTWRYHKSINKALLPLLIMGSCATAVCAPWMAATQIMTGKAALNTNSGFNLYLGNNPAATGSFVSIADTPAGDEWHAMLEQKGEAGASSELGQRAIAYMLANPAHTAELTIIKLVTFWQPNVPDAADFAKSQSVSMVRLIEAAQYLFFLILGAVGFVSLRIETAQRFILLLPIFGYWGLHGMAYIIMRYRDPIMPLMILMAAGMTVQLFNSFQQRHARLPGSAYAA